MPHTAARKPETGGENRTHLQDHTRKPILAGRHGRLLRNTHQLRGRHPPLALPRQQLGGTKLLRRAELRSRTGHLPLPGKRTDRGRGGLYTLIAQIHQEARTGMPRQTEHTGRHLQNDRRDNHHRKGILGLLPERLPWRQNRLPLHILRRSGRERGRHQNL